MLAKICKHLRRIEYLDVKLSSNVVSDIKLLSLGQILQENIIRERDISEPTTMEAPIEFQSFPASYLVQAQPNLKRKTSFEWSTLRNLQTHTENSQPQFSLNSSKVLNSATSVSSRHAFELFHQMQRQRKIWWMQYMYNPGQIVFANPQRTETSQSVSICLKSALSQEVNIELERIGLYSVGESPKSQILHSWMSLDVSTLGFLIDALPEASFDDFTLHLHRRLSPFKFVLLAEEHGDRTVDKEVLGNLAKLVELELLNSKLKVLNRVGDAGKDLSEQVSQADQMGIPYSLILGRETLETGCLKLRSRNTSLAEVLHISDIPEYTQRVVNG